MRRFCGWAMLCLPVVAVFVGGFVGGAVVNFGLAFVLRIVVLVAAMACYVWLAVHLIGPFRSIDEKLREIGVNVDSPGVVARPEVTPSMLGIKPRRGREA